MNLLTLTEISQRTGYETSTLRRAIQRGNLKATKLGKTWLVAENDLKRWLDNPQAHKTGKKPKK